MATELLTPVTSFRPTALVLLHWDAGGRLPLRDRRIGELWVMKKKLRILGVDDEPIIGESIVFALEAPHRTIVVAKDGHEALKLATKEKFDVVITDHRMPRAGGLELVKKLRARNYTGRIIVLSGHLSPENIGIYEELDVDEVVGKPIVSEELRDIISDMEALDDF